MGKLGAAFLAMMIAANGASAAEGLVYISEIPSGESQVIIDSRSAEACEKASFPGARCLPADDFFGPGGRLAGFANTTWLFGTAGLTGAESIVVIGDRVIDRDFVGGMLYLAGQRRVSVFTERFAGSHAGTPRATTRQAVFQAPARDRLVLFVDRLAAQMETPPPLLDGRSEKEYWGALVRGRRGGHIAGADHLAALSLRAAVARGEALGPIVESPVAYGHDAREGIAYFTLLRAGLGLDARVYPGGWAEWAENPALPSAATSRPVAARAPAKEAAAGGLKSGMAGGLIGVALTLAVIYLLPRRKVG